MQKSIYTWLVILCCSFFFVDASKAQNSFSTNKENIWQEIDHRSIVPKARRTIIPKQFKSYHLDIVAFKAILQQAPLEEKVSLNSSSATIELPLANGNLESFKFVESLIMEAELSSRFPNIKTYLGTSLRNPLVKLRMDWTDRGFHAMLLTPEGTMYIDPFSRNDLEHYIVYFKNDYQALDEPHFQCEFKKENNAQNTPDENTANMVFGDCQIRSYRLAVATSGEYSNYHGATSSAQASLVLSAVTTTVNRVNTVYEVDFGVRLVLIGNTDQVFYYNASSDPFDPNNMGSFLSQNKSNMSSVIGNSNFDIGHAFAQNATNNGLANLGVICSSSKAGGVTRLVTPEGDPFDIDYVSHEIGHQFGANHTQNNSCNNVSATSYEPGSASTIMGYAGICSPNVQNNSDAYFHAISVSEVSNHISGSGNSCATIINTGNQQPSVSAGADYTIPKSTPFTLTATGSDPDNDALTYCWEQWDRQSATMPPVSTSTVGPAFRSILPTADNSRTFPNLNDLVANVSPTWEVLSSVSRDLNFQITVRDNAAGGGCTDNDLMKVTVNGNSGPFLVNAPNTNVTWGVGNTETVSWDVANTTASPVSCANVDILLSTDGGFTYPITLASSVANDGSHAITVPNNATTTARVKVICANNIFFDISNQNFTIEVQDPNLCGVPDNLAAMPAGTTALLSWNNGVNANSYELEYKESANATWIAQSVSGSSFNLTNLVSCTSYDFRVKSICTNNSSSFSNSFTFDSDGCPTCTDGIQNGNETDVDCGGPDCPACPSCTDGIQNGDETGVDCGGANCPVCPITYCDSEGNDTSYEYIDAVSIGSINNTSGNNGGYADYTSLSTTVDLDNSYAISLTPGFASSSYNEYWNVYIDYNIDGDFEDAGELAFQGFGSSNVTGNIAIPSTATLGTTRMRIQMQYNTYPANSCASFTYGEVEDYSLVISTTVPTCTDGIQNGDETGVDCGGTTCPACCPLAGTACDDGDPSTENDVEDGNCNCAGTPCPVAGTACNDNDPTTGNDIEDGNCNCTGTPCPLTGTACNDNNPATENDIEDGNCNCVGTPCPTAGTACDDGNPATGNDIEDGNCNCAGTPCPVAGTACNDNDPSTENDIEDGNCNCTGTPCPLAGTACDDGNPATQNDAEDGNCNCIGTPCPTAGTACDDGNPATGNDVEDGNCNCTGTPCPIAGTACNDNDPSTENDVEDGNCNCAGTPCPIAGTVCNDGNPATQNDVEDGNCNCTGVLCPTAGTACDDGDPSTENDVEDGNCNCAGTPCPIAGTACNDNDPSTENDVEDGNCNCAGTPISALKIEYGLVQNVSSSWQTITLNENYNSMVVIASVVLPSNTVHPVVSRIRNASGNSFDVRIQEPGGNSSSSFDVYFVAVEEGVYTQANDGITMEAVKANSSLTANNTNWVRETRVYQNSYTSPVVVGQVMSYNDSNWSVFWASSNTSRSTPPTASSFAAGKEVAEDSNQIRADETIGYLVIEAGSGSVNGLNFSAGLGSDIIRGVGNSSGGYKYTASGLVTIDAAVLSVAAMDGVNGGWPTLFSANPFMTNQIIMAFDEDQIKDPERKHTTEQVAYLAFGTAAASKHTVTNSLADKKEKTQVSQLKVFPNPVVNQMTIQYFMANDGTARIELYDILGDKVSTLIQQEQVKGHYSLDFEHKERLNGFYFLVFTINEERIIQKIVFKTD